MNRRTPGLLGILIFLMCFKAFSGVYNADHTALIDVGDNAYTVYKALGEPNYKTVIYVPSGRGNEEIDYYTINGQDHQIHMIDGTVYSIDGDENIN